MDANYNKNLVVGFAAEMPNGDAVVFCFWFYPLEVWALHDLAALSAPPYEWRPVQLHRSPTPNAGPASTERKKTKKGLLAADKYHVSGGPGTATLAGILVGAVNVAFGLWMTKRPGVDWRPRIHSCKSYGAKATRLEFAEISENENAGLSEVCWLVEIFNF